MMPTTPAPDRARQSPKTKLRRGNGIDHDSRAVVEQHHLSLQHADDDIMPLVWCGRNLSGQKAAPTSQPESGPGKTKPGARFTHNVRRFHGFDHDGMTGQSDLAQAPSNGPNPSLPAVNQNIAVNQNMRRPKLEGQRSTPMPWVRSPSGFSA